MSLILMLTFSACALFAKSSSENFEFNNTLKTDTIPTDSIPKDDTIPKKDTVSLRNMNNPVLIDDLNVKTSHSYLKNEIALAVLPSDKKSALKK